MFSQPETPGLDNTPKLSDTHADLNASVLIIEDDAAIRSALSALLGSYSVPVCWATTGAEAIEILDGRTTPPQLIIVDGRLPDQHGVTLIQELRERLPNETEIFLFSADPHVEKTAITRSGASGFLRKPADIERLIELAVRFSV